MSKRRYDQEKKAKYSTQFLKATAIVLAICAPVAFFFIIITQHGGLDPEFARIAISSPGTLKLDQIELKLDGQTLANYVAMVVGTSVAFAGAWVAISIADSALEAQKAATRAEQEATRLQSPSYKFLEQRKSLEGNLLALKLRIEDRFQTIFNTATSGATKDENEIFSKNASLILFVGEIFDSLLGFLKDPVDLEYMSITPAMFSNFQKRNYEKYRSSSGPTGKPDSPENEGNHIESCRMWVANRHNIEVGILLMKQAATQLHPSLSAFIDGRNMSMNAIDGILTDLSAPELLDSSQEGWVYSITSPGDAYHISDDKTKSAK